ncbi:MAG: hypothetical protein Q9M94_02795 [Candidatus Gracilibacteria bacterium]|nr:hypothetical protein [Candidatus Gracilibacteria bacterium]MDQ7022690.1 hypothetical protein [Candidatus Gracilibacteria bacterium]
MEIVLEKNRKIFIEELSFKDICDGLDRRKEKFEKSGRKGNSPEEVWVKSMNRKNTFLTSK